MKLLKKIKSFFSNAHKNSVVAEDLKFLLGQSLVVQHNYVESFEKSEFKVFSQFGDDGIIQFLTRKIQDIPKVFIEFGVENYRESNTRFLLKYDNWKGLIIDGSEENINFIKKEELYWQHDLTALASFVTAENINSLLETSGFTGEIGLLSIDVDGNDYWILNALTVIKPVIIIVEYNSLFGQHRPITIPYNSNFIRSKFHYSHLYFGTSLSSLYDLSLQKGYSFLGCNKAGNNAYFVLNSHVGTLQVKSLNEGFVEAKFRESRAIDGSLSFSSIKDGSEIIKGLPVYNTFTKKVEVF